MKLSETYFLRRYRAATLHGAAERASSQERAGLFIDWNRLPVDVECIAALRGMRVVGGMDAQGCAEGKLIPVKGGFLVQLRQSSSATRKRFSMAHELGHALFYRDEGECPRHQIGLLNTEERSAEERICNLFAECLLMPALNLRNELGVVRPDSPCSFLDLLERTARKFHVSLHALITRLARVRVEGPPYLIAYQRFRENAVRGGDAQLRVDTFTGLGRQMGLRIWPNQTVAKTNLGSAISLFDEWRHRRSDHGDQTGGRYAWSQTEGLRRVGKAPEEPIAEQLHVSWYEQGRWYKAHKPFVTTSRLYAAAGADETKVYVVTVLLPRE
jgi:hypothetical protein